jgi:PAS domain S-box-containing protein/putative nucleotidyltransferase with HDIG domain
VEQRELDLRTDEGHKVRNEDVGEKQPRDEVAPSGEQVAEFEASASETELSDSGGRSGMDALQRAQERLLALSRTAAKVQSVLEPDRIFETIGDELRTLGLSCLFGLVDDRGDEVILRHINVGPKVLRAAETLGGMTARGFRFSVDASPLVRAVTREGVALLDDEVVESARQVLPPPLKVIASRVTDLLQAHRAISAPLLAGERTLGILTVWSDDLTEDDVPAISLFAQQAAMAIENASLYQEQMRRAFEMEALRKTTLEMTRQLHVPELLSSIVERAAALVGTRSGALYLYHPEEQELELVVSHHLGKDYTGTRLEVGEGVAGQVLLTGETLVVEDYATWEGRSDKYSDAPFRGVMGVPLKWGEKVLGVVNVTDVEEPRTFTDRDLWLLELFASHAAIAIDNARSYAAAERRVKELTALREISLQITQSLDLSTVLDTIAESAVKLVGATDAHIFLYDEKEGEFAFGTGVWATGKEGPVFTQVREDGLTATVVKRGEPVVINEARTHPLYCDKVGREWGIEAIAGFPLKRAGKVLGVFNVAFLEPHTFDEEQLRLLMLLGDQAAIAIENSRLYEDATQRAEELAGLYEVSMEMASELDLPALLNTVVERAIHLLRGRAAGVYLYDPKSQDLQMIANSGHSRERTGIRLALGEGLCGKIAQSGKPLVVTDYANWEERSAHFDDESTANVLGVPIQRGDSLLGVLFVDDADLKRTFDERDMRLATLFANQAAIAIDNAQLFAERERRIKQLAALHDVSLEIVAKTDLSEVLPAIVEQAAQLLDAQAGAIDLFDPETEELELTVIYGYSDDRKGIRHAMGEGVVGKVAQSQQPFIVDDYAHWEGRSAQWERQPVGTVMGIPLKRADRLLGVLTLDRPVSHPFDDNDLQLATLFANQAVIAIENARSVAATRRRVGELATLREISLQLTQSLDLSRVLDTIVQSAVSLVKASDAHIFLYDEENGEFNFGTGAWAPGQQERIYKQVRENGLTATVARRGEPVVINDATSHALFKDSAEQGEPLEAIAGFPLKRADKVLGVFNVAFVQPHTFDDDELRVLTLLADQAAIAIENARLYQETDRRLRESETLQVVSRLVNSSLEPTQIFQTVVERLASAFGYSIVSIYITEGEGLRLGAQVGYDPTDVIYFIPFDEGVIGRVARTGEGELIADVTQDADFLEAAPGVVSEVAVPIEKDHQVLGVLNVESTASEPLTTADLDLISSMGHQVSVAMQNAQLYQDVQRELAERERAQEAYRAVVDHSLQGLVIIQDFRVLFTNQAFAEISGYSVEELLSLSPKDVRALVHPEDQELVWGRFRDRTEGRLVPPHYEYRGVTKDGLVVWLELFANPIQYRGGPAVQAAIVDITERKRAEEELEQSLLQLRRTLEGTVNALAALAEARDPYTAGHQQRVADLACAIAKEIGLSDEQISGLRMAGLVHDIGKIHVPAEILSKPTALTEIEMQMIKTHPVTAYDILKSVEFPWPVARIVLEHHERVDGSGYPRGLPGAEVLLEARILAVADVVEAMASDRPYRPAHGIDKALGEISRHRATHYDAEAVDACLRLFRDEGFQLQGA